MSDPQWIIVALGLVSVALLVIICLRLLRPSSADAALIRLEQRLRDDATSARQDTLTNSAQLRDEMRSSFRDLETSQREQFKMMHEVQSASLDTSRTQQLQQFDGFRGDFNQRLNEQNSSLGQFSKSVAEMSQANADRGLQLRDALEKKVTELQDSNARKLDEMRVTVDEKLQGTLEKRLGESFKLVSDRLEMVQKGLGEMQNLAVGVGDLKKVLTNIKTRGSWGEMQLGALLEEMLSADQFERNVKIRPRSGEVVEFAIRLPGQEDDGVPVYLPIDSKFPKEDFDRLQAAQDAADVTAVEAAAASLEVQIKKCARDIRDKYIHPPHSTHFAIMFLPVESLYAEVLRRPGLASQLQTEYRVTVAGPTNLAAILNSLQMGFRTLAIQKRSGEVWKVLSGVKHEFGKFGDLMEKAGKQLETVQRTITTVASKTRTIEGKLKSVEAIAPVGAESHLVEAASTEEVLDGMLDGV